MWILLNVALLALTAGGLVGNVAGLMNLAAVLVVLSVLASLALFKDEARVEYANRPRVRRLGVGGVRVAAACLWIWYGHMVLGSLLVFSVLLTVGAYMYAVEHGEVDRGQETKE